MSELSTKPHVLAYADGSSRGNPGPGGYGALLVFTDKNGTVHEREFSGGYRCTTNNRMELKGAIAAFEGLKYSCEVDFYSDSQYVINAFVQGWVDSWIKNNWKNAQKKPVKNADLWKELIPLINKHTVYFHWVKGHAGHPENERCDALACAAADNISSHIEDEGFQHS